MGFWEGLRRGSRAVMEGRGPGAFEAGGLRVRCPHCEGERFDAGRALLNTSGMTLLNLDWMNKEATTLMCERCGLVQWFGIRPERVAEEAGG